MPNHHYSGDVSVKSQFGRELQDRTNRERGRHRAASRRCAHCSQWRWAHSTSQAVATAVEIAIIHIIVGPAIREIVVRIAQ
jgi:hypothetical protein